MRQPVCTEKTFAVDQEMRRADDTRCDRFRYRRLKAGAADSALHHFGTMATAESMAVERQRRMILDSKAGDIVYTPAVSGIPGNFLRASLAAAGRNPDDLTPPDALNFGTQKGDANAWRDLWAAGQGVGAIDDVPRVAALVDRLEADYRSAASLLA